MKSKEFKTSSIAICVLICITPLISGVSVYLIITTNKSIETTNEEIENLSEHLADIDEQLATIENISGTEPSPSPTSPIVGTQYGVTLRYGRAPKNSLPSERPARGGN